MDENQSAVAEVASEPTASSAEKLVPQEKVSKLVGDARTDGHQRGYQQALKELQAQQAANQAPASTNSLNLTEETVGNIVNQRLQQVIETARQEEINAQTRAAREKLASELNHKLSEAKAAIPDFEEKTGSIAFGQYKDALALTNNLDPSIWGHVMVEFTNNPAKLEIIDRLASKDPGAAKKELKKLADSIADNQKALDKPMPRDPLNSVKPSSVSTGKKLDTVEDFKAFYRGKF